MDSRSARARAIYLHDLRALSRWMGKNADLLAIAPDHLARFRYVKSQPLAA
jgi:hypothetical protein